MLSVLSRSSRGAGWAAAALLSIVSVDCQVVHATSLPQDSVLFGVEIPRLGVSVFSASGRLRLALKPIPSAAPLTDPGLEAYAHAYFAPSIDPKQRYLVYVDCVGLVLRGNDPQAFEACSLLQRDLDSGAVRTILDPGPGLFPDSPSWSDDGTSIALLLGTDAITMVPLTGTITARIPAVMTRPTSPDWGANRDYVRYGEDGRTLLVNLTDDCQATDHAWSCRMFASLDTQQGTIHRLDTTLGALNLSRGLYLPTRARFDGAGNEIEQPTAPPKSADLERLLGDIDHPVYAPIFSGDRRCFFYVTFREGWFGSTWIEGHDRREHRTFRVKTLQRSLYSE
jgi:hypothetical protein